MRVLEFSRTWLILGSSSFSSTFGQIGIMGVSCFIHFYGEAKHAAALCSDAEARLRTLKSALGINCSIVLHSPLVVSGDDPLPVAQDARMLLCQVSFPDERMLAVAANEIEVGLSGLAAGDGVRHVHSHAMTTEWLKAGSPDDPRTPAKAVSFFVQYDGPAEDPAAFHNYYRSHHVPIVFRMPGIRAVAYHLPTPLKGPAIGQSVERLQIVQAVFNSAGDFIAMRQSGERKEGLRDFDNYPKFEGPVTHQVMDSSRLD
jgi:uncharacterized protein (TIGR02118 family)